MGYYIDVYVDASIEVKNEQKALNAIKKLGKEQKGLAWVYTDEVLEADNLPDALTALRYESEYYTNEETGKKYVCMSYFCGEKWGDDEKIFTTLAPFMVDGSTVEFIGEDGSMWRYLFNDGKLKEQQGEIVWK